MPANTPRPWNEDEPKPARRRRAAKKRPAAAVTVVYKGTDREVLYRPNAPVYALLADAVRAHGLRFAASSRLRLHHDSGKVFAHNRTADAVGINPGARILLQPPAPERPAS